MASYVEAADSLSKRNSGITFENTWTVLGCRFFVDYNGISISNYMLLTVEVINDSTSLQHSSPVSILTTKSKVVSPPPEEFPKPYIFVNTLA